MQRATMLDRIAARADDRQPFDVLVIGGGATGLGVALDAALRGYAVLLAEGHDFAKGTSSKSTKLIHGGVRYLRQGDLPLVRESLRERGRLLDNAPHLVRPLQLVTPGYKLWEPLYYTLGLKLYDALAGDLNLARSRLLSHRQTLDRLPNLNPDHLHGGTLYSDAQFDDARLAVTLATNAARHGATLANYLKAVRLTHSPNGILTGAVLHDTLGGREFEVHARVTINATGPLGDQIRHLDAPDTPPVLTPSKGIHLVVPKTFLPGDTALLLPSTDDGRVLFAIPFLDHVVVGTTDTPVHEPSLEPRVDAHDINYLLDHLSRYLTSPPGRSDVRATFAGLRPLVGKSDASSPSATLSRSHKILTSKSGLVSILGGKWTTYRNMAEETVDHAAHLAGLPPRPCSTTRHRLDPDGRLPATGTRLHPAFPYTTGDIIHAARNEMAVTLEDALARRTRCLLLDTAATLELAPAAADLMASELGHSPSWRLAQLAKLTSLARPPASGHRPSA